MFYICKRNKELSKFIKLCYQFNYIIIIFLIALKRCVNDMRVNHNNLKTRLSTSSGFFIAISLYSNINSKKNNKKQQKNEYT